LRIVDDRYELSELIGRGATGAVWEARDRVTTRLVAVKVFEPHVVASRQARKRFLREVETASALAHPHVVEVFGHGTTPDGGAYLVMERLFGKTLAARLRELGPLPQPRAIRIITQVLDAVLAAHRLGVVHRDLKPSNVMLVEHDGDPDFVKVCDFGLAKDIERDSFDPIRDGALAVDLGSLTTEQGHLCGTPEYMSPEQARGEAVDERADLYAVAVMLFQAVVGRPPFSARSPLAVVSLQLTAAPPRPRELRPDLAIFPPLESLILRGLEKDRTERPSSAEVFREDLLRIERDYPRWAKRSGPASSVPVESPTLPPAPRAVAGPAPRALGVIAAAAALVGLGSVAWNEDLGRSPAVERPRRALDGSFAGITSSWERGAVQASLRALSTLAPVSLPSPPPLPTEPAVSPKPAAPNPGPLARAAQELAQGRVAEACLLGEEAAARTPSSASVWKFLGQCSMRLGERERGVAYYRRYLALAPEGPDAVFVREMIK
jgi:serine/threonine protein kinase